jgi:hypothetical protein
MLRFLQPKLNYSDQLDNSIEMVTLPPPPLKDRNFDKIGHTDAKLPNPPATNPVAIENHKLTCLRAFTSFLYPTQIEYILLQKRRSTASASNTLADLFHGDIPFHEVIKDKHYYSALSYIQEKFQPPRRFRPVHFLDVQHHYPHRWTSNAEPPFSTEPFFFQQMNNPVFQARHPTLPLNPRRSLGNMKDIVFDYSRRFIHEIKDGCNWNDKLYYILLHSKTALIDTEDPDKIRTVWGFPRMTNLAYIMFLWPYMAWMKRHPGVTPILWGYETLLGGMFRINAELHQSHIKGSIVTLDKSRFDKYFRFSVQDDIDKMIRSFINFDDGYIPTREYPFTRTNWIRDNQPERLSTLWSFLCHAFRFTPIALYDGTLLRRTHSGMPSGIYVTQLYDTIYFGITNICTLLAMGFTLSQIIYYKGEGDDIIFKLSVLIQPNEHETFLSRYSAIDSLYFGSLMRPEKSKVFSSPQGAEVLGYSNNFGMPERDLLDLLAQMYHTKMTKPTPSKTMATAVGIYYATMGSGPRYLHQQVRSVCENIYTYYATQGYTPDEKAFQSTFFQDVHTSHTITAERFPTKYEIQRQLMSFSYNEPETMSRFWPDWFLTPF